MSDRALVVTALAGTGLVGVLVLAEWSGSSRLYAGAFGGVVLLGALLARALKRRRSGTL